MQPKEDSLTLSQQQYGMRLIIWAQCFGMIYVVLLNQTPIPTLIALKLGATKLDVFLMLAIQSITTLISVPVAWYLDRHPRKPFIIRWWSLSNLFALGIILAPFIQQTPLAGAAGYFFLGFLILHGLFRGIGGVAWLPMLRDIVTPSKTAMFFSKMRFSWQSVGFACVVATTLFLRYGNSTEGSIWQYQLILFIAMIGLWVRIFLITRFPVVPFQKNKAKHPFLKNLRVVLHDRGFKGFLVYMLLWGMLSSYTMQLVVFYMIDLEFGDATNVFAGGMTSIGLIIGLSIAGLWVRRFGSRRTFYMLHGLKVLVYITVFGIWDTSWLSLILCYFMFLLDGFIASVVGVARTVKLLQLTPRYNTALFIGTFNSLLGIANAIPPVLMGFAVEHWLPLRIYIGDSLVYSYQLLLAGTGVLFVFGMLLLRNIPKDTQHIQ